MSQIFYEIITIVSTKCSCNFFAPLERRIAHNGRKSSFFLQINSKHLRELKRPMERPSPLQEFGNLFTHYLKILSEIFTLGCGEILAACILKGSYQHGVT